MLRGAGRRGRHPRGRAGNKAPCAARAGRGLQPPQPRGAGQGARACSPLLAGRVCSPPGGAGRALCAAFAAPCPGGAGAASPGPRRGSGCAETTPPWLPAAPPCPRPGEGHLGRLPGGGEGGAGRGLCCRQEKGCPSPIRTPPCQPRVCSGSMPPPPPPPSRKKPLPPHPHTPAQPGWPSSVFGSTQNGFGEDLWDSLG